MIIPSIDISRGRAVQLRRGREQVLDGGDPLERLEQFAVAGEVAVVDLDAALGRGSNADLIREMVIRAPCRVGGGIRDLSTARDWLDAGAHRIMIGTAASPEFCAQLPADRLIAAVDADKGTVVVEGWRTRTGDHVLDRIQALAPHVRGFLFTQVEHEGGLRGFDADLIEQVQQRAGHARVTAAGGITTLEDVAALDESGVDAQVGMALYTGRFTIGQAIAASLRRPVNDLWPTVVCDEHGVALGLVWSSRETVARAADERRGIYWSRSRNEVWIKGAASGATQQLLRVDLDCDRDALRFVVRQAAPGFCHRGVRSCWPPRFDLPTLERVLAAKRDEDPASGSHTARLFRDPVLLASKLAEEAAELASAGTDQDVVHEAADVIYFTLVALARGDATLEQVEHDLARRHGRVRRRPMTAKTGDETT